MIFKRFRLALAVATTLEALQRASRFGAETASIPDTTLAWALVPTTTQFGKGILRGMLVTGKLTLIRDWR